MKKSKLAVARGAMHDARHAENTLRDNYRKAKKAADEFRRELQQLRQRVAELTEKNQNLFNALMASTQQKDNLYKSIKGAIGHLNLYGLFSCVEGDSYDPECADKNVRKALSILKSELTTDIIKPAGKEDQAVCDSILKEQYK